MEPVINPWVFYLIELADGLKLVFGGLGFAIGLVLIISGQFDMIVLMMKMQRKSVEKRKRLGLLYFFLGVLFAC